ncbi:DNA-3-methyladenine glycosylase [Agrococcus sp. SGAir0287]|uniref:DNA-3-methyladenine glycosylase n=1 Tax=Agrococcus sp. SGAir0287 TaxID=2070347 RepID=UPI0010CD3672|nr:DNA-3-methyladenine glycosylase [Agrococcus sp. SGAir0287]QCR19720.1 DNA-3-methyladenine glycosylase [Agrococcus sp. SGAir0287]
MTRPDRAWLARDPIVVAPLLLGATLAHASPEGRVAIRITEVEAYRGADDPGAHSFRGRTRRNATMFGEAGHLYAYFTYGMHHAINVVAGDREGFGILVRAGAVVEGEPLARARREARPRRSPIVELARGPGNVAQALGATLADDGADLLGTGPWTLEVDDVARTRPMPHRTGPRVGVSGDGGDGRRFPWRFWLPGEPSVSAYRAAASRRRRQAT